jgi:hypothetical protein
MEGVFLAGETLYQQSYGGAQKHETLVVNGIPPMIL